MNSQYIKRGEDLYQVSYHKHTIIIGNKTINMLKHTEVSNIHLFRNNIPHLISVLKEYETISQEQNSYHFFIETYNLTQIL